MKKVSTNMISTRLMKRILLRGIAERTNEGLNLNRT